MVEGRRAGRVRCGGAALGGSAEERNGLGKMIRARGLWWFGGVVRLRW